MTPSGAHPLPDDLLGLAMGEDVPGGRAALEAHLDECEACRREYAGMVETLAALAYAAPPAAPPTGLRSAILAAAAREPRPVPLAAPAEAAPAGPARRRRSAWPDWSRWAPRVAVSAAAVMAVVFAVLITTNAGVQTRTVALHGVSGTVSVTDGTAVLESDAFAALPADRIYEMWVIHDGSVSPAGLFRSAAPPVTVRVPVASGDTIAVTREPAGGTRQPTSTPVASASI